MKPPNNDDKMQNLFVSELFAEQLLMRTEGNPMMAANAESACVPIHRMVGPAAGHPSSGHHHVASGLGAGSSIRPGSWASDNACMKISLPRRIPPGIPAGLDAGVLNFVIGGTLYEAPADYRADEKHIREVVITGNISPPPGGVLPVSRCRPRRATCRCQSSPLPRTVRQFTVEAMPHPGSVGRRYSD